MTALVASVMTGLAAAAGVISPAGAVAPAAAVTPGGAVPSAGAVSPGGAVSSAGVVSPAGLVDGGADGSAATMAAAFTPASLKSGDVADLVFTLRRSPGTIGDIGVGFTVVLPAAVKTAGAGTTWYENTCGGTVTRPTAGAIQLWDALMPDVGYCSVTVHATAFQAGTYAVSSSDVSEVTPGLVPSFTATLSVTARPYVVAFYQPPGQTAVNVPTALGIAVINPTGVSVPFAFTATLPPHMRVADLGREIPQSPCVTASLAPAGGGTVKAAGTAPPTLGLEGCGVLVPVVVDAPGTYPATGVTVSDATNVPPRVTDVGGIGDCEPCALLVTSLTVSPPPTLPGHPAGARRTAGGLDFGDEFRTPLDTLRD
ncbi:hypothetical protein [Dactylosporangium sp. CS-033363]|uniref:DUF7933 domain-containing protein n=1 Tax=Dactylosporangium sp. CS-033363 TaxID=3239935 RepID=UPI003D8DE112